MAQRLSQTDFAAFRNMAAQRGVIFPRSVSKLALAMDSALPALEVNGGIPAIVSTYLDPEIVRILFTPNKATEIMGEKKKGSWAMDTVMIQGVEVSGDVSAYGDNDETGGVQVNSNWADRQAYRFQTMTTWGELEQERYGLALLPYVAEKQRATAQIINTAMNRFYFYGVEGLRNYGILNEPDLPAPLAAPVNSNGKTLWKDKEVIDIYNDILALYADLVARTKGVVGDGIDMASPLKLCMSPTSSVYFKRANEIVGNTVEKMVRETFPNMKFEFAPQYDTDSGELVQMICESVQGQDVGYCCFSEKMRNHPVITGASNWKQKTSAATYGTVITQPMLFAQMIGV